MFFAIKLLINLAVLAAAGIGVVVCNRKFRLKNDNAIEQLVEKEIKDETGLDIDLSPEEDTK